ncbi:hypothetical protein [Actinomyces viscosus]|nr:hypothetical protein [Actinomyces viscosus]
MAPSSPERPRRGRLVILSVVLALVLALGGGGLWALTRDSDPLSLVKAPILKAQQDLSNLGKEPTAAPFDSSGTTAIVNQQLTILRVIADRRETLVALSASPSASHAAWQVPVPDELAGQSLNCKMSTKSLDCGERISIDLASGINSPAKPSTVSAAATTTSPSQEPGQQEPSGSSTSADDSTSSTAPSPASSPESSPQTSATASDSSPAPSSPDGSTTASPAASAAPSASDSPAPASAPTSVRLSEAPSDDVPLSVSKDGAVSVNQDKVSGLSLDGSKPVWAARVEAPRKVVGVNLPSSREVWVVSDGVTMAALDGGTVLWSSKLPDGAGALNGLGTETPPRWQMSKGAIVMAHPDSLRALDPIDGATIWQVSTPVTSWAAGDGYVVVFNGSTTSVLAFDSGSSSTRATTLPTSAPTSADTPDLKTLENASLDVPGICAEAFSGGGRGVTRADMVKQAPEKTTVTFSDGKAAGTARGNGVGVSASNTISMKAAQQGLFGSTPVMVTVLDCNADNPTYGFDVLAAYNADKEMVGSLVMDAETNEIGYVSAPHMENLRVVGGTIVFDEPQLRISGDESCVTCGGSASATVTAQWDGDSLELFDVVYHLPTQDIHRPSLATVQGVYNALAAKEDSRVANQVDPAVLSSLDQPAGAKQAGDATLRTAFLPGKGKVVTCLLAGSKDSSGASMALTQDLPLGSIVCPITSDDPSKPWMQPTPMYSAQAEYGSWLVLTSDEEGFTITDIGHKTN